MIIMIIQYSNVSKHWPQKKECVVGNTEKVEKPQTLVNIILVIPRVAITNSNRTAQI